MPETHILEKSKYQWLAEWGVRTLKPGQAHVAFRGADKDFTCLPVSFAGVVYRAAREVGLSATLCIFSDCVVFAFYKPDGLMRPNMKAFAVVRSMRGDAT